MNGCQRKDIANGKIKENGYSEWFPAPSGGEFFFGRNGRNGAFWINYQPAGRPFTDAWYFDCRGELTGTASTKPSRDEIGGADALPVDTADELLLTLV